MEMQGGPREPMDSDDVSVIDSEEPSLLEGALVDEGASVDAAPPAHTLPLALHME